MTIALALTIGAIVVLLLISAYFSSSETAFTAASRARMHALEKDGNRRAHLVNRLLETRDRMIGSLLIGNNLVNITASTLTAGAFLEIFGQAGIVYATVVMSVLVIIFAEVLPKTYAITSPDRLALTLAPAMRITVAVLAPLSAAVHAVVRALLKLLPGPAIDEMTAHEELRGAIDLHHREGAVVKHDRDMLGGVLDLRNLTVFDIMVHRTKMQTLNADDAPEALVEQVLRSPYTRLPVWRGEPENIVGMMHAKSLLRAVHEAKGDLSKLDVLAIAAKPWFVPDTISLKDQLNGFLRQKAHVALIVDEYGEVLGLLTLEDILEEIVGEISDELDIAVSGIRPQPDGTLLAEGGVPIRDLNRVMDWELPDDEATTIAGLVIHEAQTIPDKGQVFTFYGFRFEILKRQRNRITQLKITPLKAAARRGGGG